MNIYLDDDSAQHLLVRLLQAAGHTVETPAQSAMAGKKDPVHFAHAITKGFVLLTHNHDDFEPLNELVIVAGGHHPGILTVRKDNDRKRDLKPAGIVRAIHNLIAAGVPINDDLTILNHWR